MSINHSEIISTFCGDVVDGPFTGKRRQAEVVEETTLQERLMTTLVMIGLDAAKDVSQVHIISAERNRTMQDIGGRTSQSAFCNAVSVTSMPSRNVAPRITLGNRFSP